jgi:hypothetical protein
VADQAGSRPKAGWFRYLKEAFLYKWNVLLFGGAAAAAVISGHAEVALPLVAAAEITYLAGLGSLPRFQAAIDAKARAEGRGGVAEARRPTDVQQRLADVLRGLSEQRRSRFLRLRAHCVEMQRIANAVRGDTHDTSGAARELRQPALDRLLWVFLRLLLSQQAIERFLRTADGEALEQSLVDLSKREAEASARADERILRSLRDSIATAQLRLDNFKKAQGNAEFVGLEIDRIESKIQALTETAISNQDPDGLSAQVDAVAEGISATEETIRELQNITGMTADVEGTPSILDANALPPTTA